MEALRPTSGYSSRMQLKHLQLQGFRNYAQANIEFFNGVHILHGQNGAGKTSIIEAIYYLALTKSFRTSSDRFLVHNQEDMFRIQGEFLTQQGQRHQVAIAYSGASGKLLSVNGQKVPVFADYIGDVPVVLLYPADLNLSQSGPQFRRRFLDILLSQSSHLYLHQLIQYNRSLRQRNLLLQNRRNDRQLLASWEENLSVSGAEIIRRRMAALQQLAPMVTENYRQLSNTGDETEILYRCNVESAAPENLEDHYRALFEKRRGQEMEYGSTLIGPHRDDLVFQLNGRPMKSYASQGEHKTFVIALKLAEFAYLQEQRSQAPILLFDDIFGELDATRIRSMLDRLGDIGQVFVTTTSADFFGKVEQFRQPTWYYQIEGGKARLAKA